MLGSGQRLKGHLLKGLGMAAGIAVAFALFAGTGNKGGPEPGVESLALLAEPVPLDRRDPRADRVGRLRYLGGLELRAAEPRFGGISAMLWEPACGRLLAISDAGAWFILEPREAGERLTGISSAFVADVRGPGGQMPVSKRTADSESLARDREGGIWVFYEQDHRGERFEGISACQPETLSQAPHRRWLVPDSHAWPANGGIEAAAAGANGLLLLTERVPGALGGRAGLAGQPGEPMQPFSYRPPKAHQPTAMDPLDPGGEDGRMLVLHRRFSPMAGVSASLALARIDGSGAAVDHEEVARLSTPMTVDNMEAVAVRAEGARRFVYLASDNNFSPLQRTLLMKFELLPPE